MTTTPLSPTELRERLRPEAEELLTRLDKAANCAVFLGVPDNTNPNHPEQLFLGAASMIRELLSAPAAPRERETLTEQELYYLRSIKRSLDEWYSLAPRGGLGGEVLADNRDWLDCFIDQHTRALAPSTSGGK